MAEIKFTYQSITDLEDIAEYISKDSLFYARMQVQKLLERTEMLEQFPFIGRIVPELKTRSVRELIEGNYRIVYRVVNKDIVHVLTFHHLKRRLIRSHVNKIIKKNP